MNTIIDGFFVLVSRAFGRYKPLRLIEFFQNVINMVIGNSAFTGIEPPPAEAQAALDDLRVKNEAALNKGIMEEMALFYSRLFVLVIIRRWANFVEANCGGSLLVLLSSGFAARKAPTPPVVPATLNPLLVNYYQKISGMLLVSFKGSRNNRSYLLQYAESADGPWIDCPLQSRTRIKVTGLTPGKTYWFRVKAIGVNGMCSGWSPTAYLMAI